MDRKENYIDAPLIHIDALVGVGSFWPCESYFCATFFTISAIVNQHPLVHQCGWMV